MTFGTAPLCTAQYCYTHTPPKRCQTKYFPGNCLQRVSSHPHYQTKTNPNQTKPNVTRHFSKASSMIMSDHDLTVTSSWKAPSMKPFCRVDKSVDGAAPTSLGSVRPDKSTSILITLPDICTKPPDTPVDATRTNTTAASVLHRPMPIGTTFRATRNARILRTYFELYTHEF